MLPSDRSDSRGSLIWCGLFFAALWAFLYFVCPYHLVYKEQLVLFLGDASYMGNLIREPAFLAVYAGDFLTQFFIYRGASATVTVLAAILLWDGLRRILVRDDVGGAALLALLPAAVEAAFSCQKEFPLSMTIGAAIAVWSSFGCSCIRNIKVRRIVALLAPALLYPLAGAHALLFVLLSAFRERRCPLFLIEGSAVVLLEGYAYGFIWQDAVIFPLVSGYNIRSGLWALSTEAALVIALLSGRWRAGRYVSVALALIAASSIMYAFYDAKEEYDLKISTLAYCGRWNEVEKMGKDNPFESQTGAYYYNLSQARRGTLADNLLKVYQPLFYGLFLPVQMDAGYAKVIAGADAPLECGDYAQAQHSAMLGMNFTPRQVSSRALRRMARIAIYNGDTLAAERYLELLKKTTLHRRWALEAEALVTDGRACALNNYRDTVFMVNDYRSSLRSVLSSNPLQNVALDYLLCYDLLEKNLVEFMSDYDRYYLPSHSGIIPPEIYQQALEMMEAGPEYHITDKVKARNQDFLSGNELKYKDSYWFYFKYAQPGQ